MAGGAGHDAHGGLFAVGVEVGHFLLGDFGELFFGQLADFFLMGNLAAAGESEGLFDEGAGGWLLGDEGEGLVLVNSDDHGEDIAGGLLGRGVEFLTEGHDVHASLTEGGTDGRGWIGLTCRDLQLDGLDDFFGHGWGLFGLGGCKMRRRRAVRKMGWGEVYSVDFSTW